MLYKFYDSTSDLYGFKDEAGSVIIFPAYQKVEGEWTNGVIAVRQDLWGLIDTMGNMLIPFQFDSIFTSLRPWVQSQKDDVHFLYNTKGEMQLSISDIIFWHFPEEGLIRVKKVSGWGCIDLAGQEVIPFIYKSLGPCKNGRLAYYENNKWGWLNKNGHALTPAIFDEVGFWNDEYWWARKDGMYNLYNHAEEMICAENWLKIVTPVSGMAAVKTIDGWKYLNAQLETILQLPPVYEWVELFREAYAPVKRNGLWGYINKGGNEVIPCQFQQADPFSEGLAGVKSDGFWGFINMAGDVIIPFSFSGVGYFKNGKASVEKTYSRWYINMAGEAVSEATDRFED